MYLFLAYLVLIFYMWVSLFSVNRDRSFEDISEIDVDADLSNFRGKMKKGTVVKELVAFVFFIVLIVLHTEDVILPLEIENTIITTSLILFIIYIVRLLSLSVRELEIKNDKIYLRGLLFTKVIPIDTIESVDLLPFHIAIRHGGSVFSTFISIKYTNSLLLYKRLHNDLVIDRDGKVLDR